MSEDIWFEDMLLPPQELVEDTAKGLESLDERRLAAEKGLDLTALQQAENKGAALERYVEEKAQGILRVHRPRWRPLTADEVSCLPTGQGDLWAGSPARGNLYLVRLGMEFDVLPEGREAGWAYSAAWCRAYLFSPGNEIQPRVVDVYPQHIYEGQPTTVKVEVGLGLQAGPIEIKIGSIGADMHLGQVTPVTVGFLGEEERAPYWELRAKEKPILGIYHFWLVVEQPSTCSPLRLSALGEGDLQTRLFSIPVGPRNRLWGERQSIALAG
jgi:hypothetical protein